MSQPLQSPLLSPGALVLVTAANGYIASHLVDQLLHYGYAVRGTVRSVDRCTWMAPLFQTRHPNAYFEIVEVTDITAPGCYSEALKGVAAVIHTAAINTLADDPDVITQSVNAVTNVLGAVAKANQEGESIKRVVITSSSWAAAYPQPNKKFTIDNNSYNEDAANALQNPNTPKEARGMLTYCASKTAAEQTAWKWIKEHDNVGFQLNTVLPSTCLGPVLAPEAQEYPSTGGFIRSLYEKKNVGIFDWIEPQWFVDVRDAARVHVAAAVLDGVQNERIFAWAQPYTWPGVAKALEKAKPGESIMQIKDKGNDLSMVPPVERARELLGRLGLKDWEGFEDSVRLNIESFYP